MINKVATTCLSDMDCLSKWFKTKDKKQSECYLQLFLTTIQFLFDTKAITKLIKLKRIDLQPAEDGPTTT
jgi:hypothetical protein